MRNANQQEQYELLQCLKETQEQCHQQQQVAFPDCIDNEISFEEVAEGCS